MTQEVYALLSQCMTGKQPDHFVFTRKNGRHIGDFRKLWAKACKQAGVPGLLFHDLRRTAARNLRRAGVAEGIIMRIGGWKTRTVFERYAIVTQTDVDEALKKLETYDHEFGHSFGHSEAKEGQSKAPVRPN
jgi:integrase